MLKFGKIRSTAGDRKIGLKSLSRNSFLKMSLSLLQQLFATIFSGGDGREQVASL
jgi:hypothetical protein